MSKSEVEPTTRENADVLRKKLKGIEARISRLANERIKLNEGLEKIERSCIHNWSRPQPVKGTSDRYERECHNCGRVEKSKDVKVQF